METQAIKNLVEALIFVGLAFMGGGFIMSQMFINPYGKEQNTSYKGSIGVFMVGFILLLAAGIVILIAI